MLYVLQEQRTRFRKNPLKPNQSKSYYKMLISGGHRVSIVVSSRAYLPGTKSWMNIYPDQAGQQMALPNYCMINMVSVS